MTEDEVHEMLRAAIGTGRGSLAAWAVKHNIIQSNLSDILRGVRKPTIPVLRAIGLRRVLSYEPMDKP